MKWLDGTVEGMIPMMIGTKIDIPVNSSMQLKNNINEEEWDTYPATLKGKRSMYLHMIEAQTYGLSKEWVELNHKALALSASHMGRCDGPLSLAKRSQTSNLAEEKAMGLQKLKLLERRYKHKVEDTVIFLPWGIFMNFKILKWPILNIGKFLYFIYLKKEEDKLDIFCSFKSWISLSPQKRMK